MHFTVTPAAVLVAASLFTWGVSSGAVLAQSNPNAEQIVKSLTPDSSSSATRGIRVGKGGQQVAPSKPSTSLSVHFATGSAELSIAATKTLDELGQALTDSRLAGNRFRIEGHTDTVGTTEENKALSERRAHSVAAYLTTKYKLASTRIEAVGMGEDGLIVPTPKQTPEAGNRRVVVVNLGS